MRQRHKSSIVAVSSYAQEFTATPQIGVYVHLFRKSDKTEDGEGTGSEGSGEPRPKEIMMRFRGKDRKTAADRGLKGASDPRRWQSMGYLQSDWTVYPNPLDTLFAEETRSVF